MSTTETDRLFDNLLDTCTCMELGLVMLFYHISYRYHVTVESLPLSRYRKLVNANTVPLTRHRWLTKLRLFHATPVCADVLRLDRKSYDARCTCVCVCVFDSNAFDPQLNGLIIASDSCSAWLRYVLADGMRVLFLVFALL